MDPHASGERDNEESEKRPLSGRVIARIIVAVYLVSLPACVQDAGHFGPGFFPLIAAIFLVPVFAIFAVIDALSIWSEASGARKLKAQWALCLLSVLTALGYLMIIAAVIYERST